jgi:hypothetical protein
MTEASAVLLDLLEATEFIAIVTSGADGPHVTGTWGSYVRKLSPSAQTIVMPVGGYHQTGANLARDDRIKLLLASQQVQGSHGPGQGCAISGTAELVTEGPIAEKVKNHFPWARGALVIAVGEITPQL